MSNEMRDMAEVMVRQIRSDLHITEGTTPMAANIGTATVKLDLDTSDFDRAMRRVRRSVRGPIWLPVYAAAVTVAAAVLAVIDVLH